MKRTTISLLVAGLFVAAPSAFAQLKVTGSVSADGIATDVKSRNGFRFEEYRDLSSGVTGGADIKGESDQYFLRFFGENIGRDDQFAEFKGGKYGAFKYSVYNNNIIHNLTFNAITPFSGIGTNVLTFPGALGSTPSTNTATWIPFDYSIKHENYGGAFELQSSLSSPFYFRATANRKETKGLRPLGSTGSSPGGPAVELPAVVNYTTTDASGEVGYATKTAQFSVNLSYSRFEDQNDFMIWRNPAITNAASTTTTEQTTLAADNNLWKVGANAMWKRLPMGSTLALRGTYSKLTNDLPVSLTGVAVAAGGTGQIVNTNPSSTGFSGDVVNKSVSASLTSNPARSLDSRIYWNWTKKENESTAIVFRPINASTGASAQGCDFDHVTGAALTPASCSTELFHYRKNNLGVDLGYRINPQNKISGGWDYTDTTRERIDFEETEDHKLYVEWKNNSLETLTGKIKYQRLQRRSDFLLGGLNASLSATNFFEKYLQRFDLTSNDQDLAKLVLDWSPQPFLDLAAEFIWKHNDYPDVILGRNNDHREELYLTASFGDPKKFRVTAFFDYEQTHYDSTHWQGTPTAATFPAPTGTTAFLWKGIVEDKNYVVGLAADWPYSDRLKFKGSVIWQDTDGTADFATNTPLVLPAQIGAYDSFRKIALNLNAIFAVDKNFDVTLGYAYEDYKYADAQMDGYNYTPLVGTTQHFLTGAYAFPAYRAHIGYLTLKYKFR